MPPYPANSHFVARLHGGHWSLPCRNPATLYVATQRHQISWVHGETNSALCSGPRCGPALVPRRPLASYRSDLTFSLQQLIRGERERSPPLPQIMQSRFPHLGNSQGSAEPECNGRASPWVNQFNFSIFRRFIN